MGYKHLILLFKEDFVLYLKTEWRLHLLLAGLIIAVSILISFCLSDPGIISRAGSLAVIIAAFMMYRSHFRGTQNEFMRITGRADRRAFEQWHPFKSREDAKREDESAFRWGFGLVVVGTFIWGYGDIPLYVFINWLRT